MARTTLPPPTRSTATRRTNRVVLALLGLLLAAAGGFALALGVGALGSANADAPVLSDAVRDVARRSWFWPAVAGAGLVLALLALRWLLVQGRSDAAGVLHLEPDEGSGATTLDPHAVTDAVEEESTALRGVSSASARLAGDVHEPSLLLVAVLDGRVPVAEVRAAVEDGPVASVRQALGQPEMPVRLDLRVSPRRRRGARSAPAPDRGTSRSDRTDEPDATEPAADAER